jgi:hypothetical protein
MSFIVEISTLHLHRLYRRAAGPANSRQLAAPL